MDVSCKFSLEPIQWYDEFVKVVDGSTAKLSALLLDDSVSNKTGKGSGCHSTLYSWRLQKMFQLLGALHISSRSLVFLGAFSVLGGQQSGLTFIWGFPLWWGTHKWMVYNGKSHESGWFGGTTISGNHHICHTWRGVLQSLVLFETEQTLLQWNMIDMIETNWIIKPLSGHGAS